MIRISNILVVSLIDDTERRAHIAQHIPELGFGAFEFVDAVEANSELVQNFYKAEKVHSFPTCFRCHEDACQCKNNIIIPQQVANWLSFKKVWERCADDPDEFFLICEDDVAFHHNADILLRKFCETFTPEKRNTLVRLSASGQQPCRALNEATYRLTEDVVMSNSAFIFNGRMAQLLLRKFDRIETTSDIWIHDHIANRVDVDAATIEPLLATDLSYNKRFARFASRIHPKGIDQSDIRRAQSHIKRVESAEEYQQVLDSWLNPGPEANNDAASCTRR